MHAHDEETVLNVRHKGFFSILPLLIVYGSKRSLLCDSIAKFETGLLLYGELTIVVYRARNMDHTNFRYFIFYNILFGYFLTGEPHVYILPMTEVFLLYPLSFRRHRCRRFNRWNKRLCS